MAVNDNGAPNTWDITTSGDTQGAINLLNMFVPYLKVTKNCAGNTGCWAPGTYTLDSPGRAQAQLANGTFLGTYSYGSGYTGIQGSTPALQTVCGIFYVDVNGYKLPNTAGKDVFVFNITMYGLVPRGVKDDAATTFDACKSQASPTGCTAWVLYNENLDYLKPCGSTLSWDGPTSCN